MKIACNYYSETEQLLEEHKIDIDYFKYPALGFQMELMKDLDAFENFCNRITKKRPILLHGLYPVAHDLSSQSMQENFNDNLAKRLITMTRTPGLSFHPALSKLSTEVPFQQTFTLIVNNARFLKEKYADKKFVSIENLDDIYWNELLKPDVITQLLKESECDFLLDISHAYCAAKWLGISFLDYLRRLPLEKVVEIHINGWVEKQNKIMCHTKINKEGYEALEYVLAYVIPDIITVEYGRHNDWIGSGVPVMSLSQSNQYAKDEIEEQIYKIHEICLKRKI